MVLFSSLVFFNKTHLQVGVELCFQKVAEDTTNILPEPNLTILKQKNISIELYQKRVKETLIKKYTKYTQETLPNKVCSLALEASTVAVNQMWGTMLSAEGIFNHTVAFAFDSDFVREGFAKIPGISGEFCCFF